MKQSRRNHSDNDNTSLEVTLNCQNYVAWTMCSGTLKGRNGNLTLDLSRMATNFCHNLVVVTFLGGP